METIKQFSNAIDNRYEFVIFFDVENGNFNMKKMDY